MENATYIGLSYQAGLERQLNVTANNVANISTPGFKARQVMFQSYMNDPKGSERPYYSTNDYAEYMDEAPGSYSQTGRPLDVALEGPGYFGMIDATGQVQYSRAGSFTLNNVGEIVGPGGLRVADDGGAPITIPAGAKDIKIADDGTVSADGNGIGQIMIREFASQQSLTPTGNSLYSTKAAALPPEKTFMRQGMIEGSNVNGVAEMSNMIQLMRNYQSVQRMLQTESDRTRSAIERLSGRGN